MESRSQSGASFRGACRLTNSRFHFSVAKHPPDAYVLLSRPIVGIRPVISVDRHITAGATFINTPEVLQALMDTGFQVADARQPRARRGTDPIHARHMIRLRPMREILTLDSCIPEVCLINAHDGTNAYQLLAGLYRPL